GCAPDGDPVAFSRGRPAGINASEQGRADGAAHVAELGEPVHRLLAEERVPCGRLFDPAQPRRAEALAEPAAADDGVDVEEGHRRTDADPERVDRLVEQIARHSVARVERPQPHTARQLLAAALAHQVEEDGLALPRLPACARLERAAAGIGLDAAAESAVAPPATRLCADVA